jgi:hypothetical protein
MVVKSCRNNNTIPHNPLLFDSGLSGMVSIKFEVQNIASISAPQSPIVAVYNNILLEYTYNLQFYSPKCSLLNNNNRFIFAASQLSENNRNQNQSRLFQIIC